MGYIHLSEMSTISKLETKFLNLWGYLFPDTELVHDSTFIPQRRYRGDLLHPETKTVIEIQGGIWLPRGGHNTGIGITRDCEKNALATYHGWAVFPIVSSMINERWLTMIYDTIQQRKLLMLNTYNVKFKKLSPTAKTPTKAYLQDAGFDLYSDGNYTIPPAGKAGISTGIALELPDCTEAQIRPRSGIAIKDFVTVLNSPGTVDSTYRGEIVVLLANFGSRDFVVKKGMKIAQLVIGVLPTIQLVESDTLSESDRGDNGFGSTGV